jgi:ureidoacrylate peracid hydrolase
MNDHEVEVASWIRPERCALTVVDVQNDFCHPNGALARMGNDVSLVSSMMPGIHRLVAGAREIKVPRIYVKTELSPWFETPAWNMRGRTGTVFDAERVPVVRGGTWGAELFELEPTPDELVLPKFRYSAFAYTPLELVLRSIGRETVVLMGTATHQCVEATARDAIGLGFYPVLVRDATASRSLAHHQMAVKDFSAHLGYVTSSTELLDSWSHGVRSSVGEEEAVAG